ncbi:MAG TPA: hypothetical protein VI819_02080 [Patescibacteria group bacterium]|nr:hypothetical protein [Patescibacteria group bacterium]
MAKEFWCPFLNDICQRGLECGPCPFPKKASSGLLRAYKPIGSVEVDEGKKHYSVDARVTYRNVIFNSNGDWQITTEPRAGHTAHFHFEMNKGNKSFFVNEVPIRGYRPTINNSTGRNW